MRNEYGEKIRDNHIRRNAYLYVRQSTLRQVFENTESTKRQYALKDKAIALGWPLERIITIDSDQGQSGASTERKGFKRLVSEVGMGNAGIVLGLEVSRLARNSSDWHRLLEICALTDTLILDEDGIYDPSHFNDRLLLGLKGTMSEAELHILRARLRGGILTKAKRGELKCPLPIGFVHDNVSDKVIRDPDQQVQESIRLLFEAFRRSASAVGAVKYFKKHGLTFPRRLRKNTLNGKANKGNIVWGDLGHSRVLQVLHNPRYAGAFFFGRTKAYRNEYGGITNKKLERDQWHALVQDAHEGYISWNDYERNIGILRSNAQAQGKNRMKSPPREGPALLQGLAICEKCGKRMTVRYHITGEKKIPNYVCQRDGIENAEPPCQYIHGAAIDNKIGSLLVEKVNVSAVEIALSVQDEIKNQLKEADKLRRQQVDRVQYEADLARRRYMQVDPENRLVADSLEAEWNDKLRALRQSQEEYEQKKENDRITITDEEQRKIKYLIGNFASLWQSPSTPHREKKRMVRLLIEDVTLHKADYVMMHVRFKGGVTQSFNIDLPKNAWQLRQTSLDVVNRIDELLDETTEKNIARILNTEGKVSGTGEQFHSKMVADIRRGYRLKSRYLRLKSKGLLTSTEVCDMLKVNYCTVKEWTKKGLLTNYRCNDKNERLYELPDNEFIEKLKQDGTVGRGEKFIELLSNRINEVQYEA